MKINYVAYDGKIFDNEKECLNYENNQKLIEGNLICLDKDLRPIDYRALDFDSEVYFILAKNDFACEALEKRFNETWVDAPEKGFQPNIVYWWNDDIMEWVIIQEELEKLKEKVKFYEDVLGLKYFS